MWSGDTWPGNTISLPDPLCQGWPTHSRQRTKIFVDPAQRAGTKLSSKTKKGLPRLQAFLATSGFHWLTPSLMSAPDDSPTLSFQGSQGRAYLFNSVVNVGCGPAEERVLLTGLHAVADIYCENCKTTLGWKYEHAFESSQKYKEGKYIIELAHMIKDNGWD
ncbi:protein yippee-like 2 isoform X1 [Pelodiscus sinensis]|uniref:protein yippee-like 2 isoform X1 n=1 Tax=Pelodiscus sinensis TaxID=13735 RepID=UPI003F6C3AE0